MNSKVHYGLTPGATFSARRCSYLLSSRPDHGRGFGCINFMKRFTGDGHEFKLERSTRPKKAIESILKTAKNDGMLLKTR